MTKSKKAVQSAAKPATSKAAQTKPAVPKPAPAPQPVKAAAVPQMSDNLPPNPGGKIGLMTALLRQPEGTTIVALCEITGWQKHSVRGALAGAVKKAGFEVSSTKEEGEARVYRVVAPPRRKKAR